MFWQTSLLLRFVQQHCSANLRPCWHLARQGDDLALSVHLEAGIDEGIAVVERCQVCDVVLPCALLKCPAKAGFLEDLRMKLIYNGIGRHALSPLL